MANLISLNTVRTNGLSLVETVNATERKADNGGAFDAIRADAIRNIASADEGTANAIVPNVLAWGASRAILQFALDYKADKLDKADKLAIGAKDLPANSPAKRRLSQYHSRFRRIAEEYDTIPQSERDEMLAGKRSFLTVYDGIVKREKAADKAKAEAEAAAAAEAAIAAAKAEGAAEAAAAVETGETLEAVFGKALAMLQTVSMTERLSVFDTIGAMVELANAALEAEPAERAAA